MKKPSSNLQNKAKAPDTYIVKRRLLVTSSWTCLQIGKFATRSYGCPVKITLSGTLSR